MLVLCGSVQFQMIQPFLRCRVELLLLCVLCFPFFSLFFHLCQLHLLRFHLLFQHLNVLLQQIRTSRPIQTAAKKTLFHNIAHSFLFSCLAFQCLSVHEPLGLQPADTNVPML